MRRLASHLALAAIWLGAFAPLVTAAEVSDLPACCRRSGMHHCQDAASEDSSNDAEFRAIRANCPYSAPLPLTGFSGVQASRFALAVPGVAGVITGQLKHSRFLSALYELAARGPPVLL